jgi:hypothetical protein
MKRRGSPVTGESEFRVTALYPIPQTTSIRRVYKMQRTKEQDERMARYLLGDLPEEEAMAVEQEYFADPEKLEEVWAVENDLVDRYVRNRLSRADRELFERGYLRSPKHRERVAVAGKLAAAAERQGAEEGAARRLSEPVSSGRRGWAAVGDGLKGRSGLKLGWYGLAAATLLIFAGLVWLVLERTRLRAELAESKAQLSEEQRHAQEIANELAASRAQNGNLKAEIDHLQNTLARQSPTPQPTGRSSVFSIILSSVLLPRSGGESPQAIEIPRETNLVTLQMKVEVNDTRKFQAAIRTVEGASIWTRRSLTPRSGMVSVNLPAGKLPLGDYILTLTGVTPAGELEEVNRYFFRVRRE